MLLAFFLLSSGVSTLGEVFVAGADGVVGQASVLLADPPEFGSNSPFAFSLLSSGMSTLGVVFVACSAGAGGQPLVLLAHL